MPVISEANNLGDILKFEAPNLYSRDEITVLAGSGSDRSLAVGEVFGKRTKSTATPTANGGNTGDGTSGAITLGALTEPGTYTLTCIATAVNAGTFQVQTPNGYRLPDLDVAQAYTGDHLNFTLADGATDFILGDKFTVAVIGDDKVVALDLSATDGTHEAAGIIADSVTAPDGTDISGVAIVRHAVVSDATLVWPSGITAQQKSDAVERLHASGILVRQGA